MLRYLRAGWERTVCSTSYSFEDIEEFGAIARDWRGTRATFRRRGREDFLSSLGLARADLLLIGWISLQQGVCSYTNPGLDLRRHELVLRSLEQESSFCRSLPGELSISLSQRELPAGGFSYVVLLGKNRHELSVRSQKLLEAVQVRGYLT